MNQVAYEDDFPNASSDTSQSSNLKFTRHGVGSGYLITESDLDAILTYSHGGFIVQAPINPIIGWDIVQTISEAMPGSVPKEVWTQYRSIHPDLKASNFLENPSFWLPFVERPQATLSKVVSMDDWRRGKEGKQKLISTVRSFVGGDSVFAPNVVSREVADQSEKLIELLPLSGQFPKVSADGDGAMLFVWQMVDGPFIVVVEERLIHWISRATTKHAIYVDDVVFDGNSLPEALSNILS